MSWARWRDEIAKACDGSHHSIETIEQTLRDGRAHLFMTDDACLIAEVVDYPAARACQVMWAAGELASVKAAGLALEPWAKSQGCTEMLVEGHPGWQRALKDIGYSPWSVTVRKAL